MIIFFGKHFVTGNVLLKIISMFQRFLFLTIFGCFAFSHMALADDQQLRDAIRHFVENKPEGDRYRIDGERLYSSQLMPRFYANRFYNSAWTSQNGITANAEAMIQQINSIDLHGLQPSDYHQELILKYYPQVAAGKSNDTEMLMKIDILLTDAFLLLGAHLYFGKVDPEKNDANWKIQRKEPELLLNERLERAVSNTGVVHELNQLLPGYRSYQLLKSELVFYRSIENDDWPRLSVAKALKPGDVNPVIPKIRKRLAHLNYPVADTMLVLYDDVLEKTMKMFQRRHGLNDDGVIGRLTVDALNVTPAQRADMVRVNMERLRWLPVGAPEKFILVNIANFEMDLLNGRDTLLNSRAIVGKNYRKTPAFTANMTYLVFSPTWVVPPGILNKDVIPAVQKDIGYLAKKNMKVLTFDGNEVDPATIDWSKHGRKNFPYMVRQEPGEDNALGWVKFMFPNQYDVYIHDTPNRELFKRDERTFSSGCIRIEKPFDLAKILLSDKPEWDESSIRKAMYSGKEQTVKFTSPIPVVIVYFTSWVDGNDQINFRKDVYERDKLVSSALRQKPSYARGVK